MATLTLSYNGCHLTVDFSLVIRVWSFSVETATETAAPTPGVTGEGFVVPVIFISRITPAKSSTLNFLNNAAITPHRTTGVPAP